MKLCVIGDVHWSAYSSIIRKRGAFYTARLHNCIQSVNWAEEQAQRKGCSDVIYLGDFFDRADMDAEEISALREIRWAPTPHTFLIGNHETTSAFREYSSADVFLASGTAGWDVVGESACPIWTREGESIKLGFIPYHLPGENGSVVYPSSMDCPIVFSHNDIKGVQYGAFLSTVGLNIEDIQAHCKLFINGHIHNGGKVAEGIYNIGNLTGQNFNEDAEQYKHEIFIVDTNTLEIERIENPYAFNFYKREVNTFEELLTSVDGLKAQAVVSLKCPESLIGIARELLSKSENVAEYRVISVAEDVVDMTVEQKREELKVDHLKEFFNFVEEKMGISDRILEELEAVCK